MQTIDLTNDYLSFLNTNNTSQYIKSCPFLFKHYFQYWGEGKKNFPKLKENDVLNNRKLILNSLQKIRRLFNKAGINSHDISVIIFIGQGTANGHAFIHKGKSYAWIAAEDYNSQLYSDVMCLHEIVHALHYANVPSFYFRNSPQKKHTGRLLITEGIASYVTKKLLRINNCKALWGDFLSAAKAKIWLKKCEEKSQEISDFIYKNFNSTAANLFYLYPEKEAINDPFKSRGGYWLGLKLIEQIVKEERLSLNGILKMDRKILEKEVFAKLKFQLPRPSGRG